jgi:hypothetical protein
MTRVAQYSKPPGLAGWLGLLLTTRRVGQDMDCFDGLTAFPLTCEMALAG